MSLRSRRWVASSILLMAFLVAIVFFLLFSAFGSQLVWNQLVRVVPDLKGELVSGSLADGWQVHDLQWQNKEVTVSLKQGQAQWKLASLLAGEVEVDGETVHLTKKEYSLLEYMMRNKRTVLTRDQIREGLGLRLQRRHECR